MDNGWEILSPKDEEKYQKRVQTTAKLIVFVGIPLWVVALIAGLISSI